MESGIKHSWQFFRARLEAFVWIAALLLLGFMSPTDAHASLCPIHASGLGFCPGCGLGHSISWLFRGEFVHSFNAHPLGIAAVVILVWRIIAIFKKPVFYY
ncbi:MAG: hypothetical protein CVU14_08315 [Bacteroidetes bacterium HGW-Bacteroidetes-9]|nr:MAG: hypothetical protein CVU14_08315 [Bacteroidetes bacterium HGW-Bacteroidetes-9]